jgi:hypothetical protein
MVFHYGAHTLDWDQVLKLVNVYGQMPLLRQQADTRDGQRWRWHHIMLIRLYRARREKKPPMTIDFAHLLQTGSLKECSDQRDRVYGVLGMAEKSIRDRILDLKDLKGPNISVEEVFVDAFRVVVGCDPGLRFLSLSYERGGKYVLPTWCPDLTQGTRTAPKRTCSRRERGLLEPTNRLSRLWRMTIFGSEAFKWTGS